MIRSGSEVHLCGGRGRCIVVIWADIPRAERPDAIDGQRLPACILQQSVEFSGSQIVSGDEAARLRGAAARELPNEQVMAKGSKIEWSQSHAPGSVQPIAVF